MSAYEIEPEICEEGGEGVFLPFSSSEHKLGDAGRSVLYLALLFYTFMGVNFASDYFMLAIENITAKKKRVWNPKTARHQTILVWNETVANLTLMALGSSAPEILLNCVETIASNKFFSGSLGPSVIVGSAAFNLLVIIAVCIAAIPSPETRYIKVMAVYHITALFSIFAYVWLLMIVDKISPSVVEPWEAIITLLMMPAIVILSFLADKGHMSFMALETCESEKDSRDMPLGNRLSAQQRSSYIASAGISEENDVGNGGFQQSPEHPRLRSARKSHRSSAKVLAHGDDHPHDINHKIAKANKAHPHQAHILHDLKAHAAGVETKIDIMEGVVEECVDLDGNKIISDNGILRFKTDDDVVVGTNEPVDYKAIVYRSNGYLGEVSCKYHTEGLTALPGYDYEDVSGQLKMAEGVMEKDITLVILPKQVGERSDEFQLILDDVEGGAIFNPVDDGGTDRAVLTVTITNGNKDVANSFGQKVAACLRAFIDVDNFNMGLDVWKVQIIESINFDEDEDDGEDEAAGQETEESKAEGQEPEAQEPKNRSVIDYVMYVLNLPWKIAFAVCSPPPNWGGGWVLFTCELGLIGLLTAFIADLAELFGCCAGIAPEATAITVVALGTSLPDTFASVSAAKGDEYADASIVNVTGSNSVNVFLGIGLPWTLASVFWLNPGDSLPEWKARYSHLTQVMADYPNGAFVVEAGTLSFTVAVFCAVCLIALSLIRVRRLAFGGELGGPFGAKVASSATLLGCWVTYIASSIWRSKSENADVLQIPLLCLAGLVVLCAIVYEVMHRKKGAPIGPPSLQDEESSAAAPVEQDQVGVLEIHDPQGQVSAGEPSSTTVGKPAQEVPAEADVANDVKEDIPAEEKDLDPEEVREEGREEGREEVRDVVEAEQDAPTANTVAPASEPPKTKKSKRDNASSVKKTERSKSKKEIRDPEQSPEVSPEQVVPELAPEQVAPEQVAPEQVGKSAANDAEDSPNATQSVTQSSFKSAKASKKK